MKRIIIFAMCALLLSTVSAQNEPKEKKQSKFGSFIRRVGESATGINMSNELFVSFDMKAQTAAQILEVTCEGNPASGELLVTILAKAKKNGTTMGLGSGDSFAADAKGNRYTIVPRTSKSKGNLDLMVDVPTRYEFIVKDVPTALTAMEHLSMDFYIVTPDFRIGSSSVGVELMQIRNIPIKWKEMPTQNVVDESYALSAITDINIVSCEGDKATGTVIVVIGATTKHKEASLSLGNNDYRIEAFDKSGNKFISTNRGSAVGEKFSKDIPYRFTYQFSDMGDWESIYLLRVGFYARGGDLGLGSNMVGIKPITIKNIPIIWK